MASLCIYKVVIECYILYDEALPTEAAALIHQGA
jgi:hypothetical protein